MLNSGVSRTYCAKNLTLDPYVSMQTTKVNLDESINKESSQLGSPKVYPYQLSRVDSRERKLDSYLHSNNSLNESQFRANKENLSQENKKQLTLAEMDINFMKSPLRLQTPGRSFNLKSLNELRETLEKKSNINVRKMFLDMHFVGIIDRELALIQHKTELYLTNTRRLSEELMYQICLFNFGNFGFYSLEEPISIVDLALLALDNPLTEWTPEDGSKEKLSTRCAKFLYSKAEMLNDYFSIKITKTGDETEKIFLEAIPMLIDNYEPDMNDLPLFVIRLATEVNWKDEKECFDSVCRQIAIFYSIKNRILPKEKSRDSSQQQSQSSQSTQSTQSQNSNGKPTDEWVIEHVIYKAFRNMLLIGEKEEQIFLKLVDLSRLYRVFERC